MHDYKHDKLDLLNFAYILPLLLIGDRLCYTVYKIALEWKLLVLCLNEISTFNFESMNVSELAIYPLPLFLGNFYIKIMPLCICSFPLALLRILESNCCCCFNYQGGPQQRSDLPLSARRENLSENERILKTAADR